MDNMELHDELLEAEAPPVARQKHEKDPKLNVLLTQLVLAGIALLVVLLLRLIGGQTLSYSKAVFEETFDKPINLEQVLGTDSGKEGAVKPVAAPVQTTTERYGMGGVNEEEPVPFFESYDDITPDLNQKLSDINTMQAPVTDGRVTSEYGYRVHPLTGKRSFHTGIDIGADSGENIAVALGGTVKKTVEDDADYGNYIIITHAGGVETMYAHCSKLLKKAGETVEKGDVIALVGSTGISTGPHLHFEVRVNDIRLNPRWFITL